MNQDQLTPIERLVHSDELTKSLYYAKEATVEYYGQVMDYFINLTPKAIRKEILDKLDKETESARIQMDASQQRLDAIIKSRIASNK